MNEAQEYNDLKASLDGLIEVVELQLSKTQRNIWEDRNRVKITDAMMESFRNSGFSVADVYEFRTLWNSYEYENLADTILQVEGAEAPEEADTENETGRVKDDEEAPTYWDPFEANDQSAPMPAEEVVREMKADEEIASKAQEAQELENALYKLSEKYEAMKKQAEAAKQEAAEAKKRLEKGTPVRTTSATDRVEKLPTLQKLVQRYKEGQTQYQRFKDASTQQECKVILAAGEVSFPTGNPKIAAAVTELLEAQFQSYLAELAEEIAAMQI